MPPKTKRKRAQGTTAARRNASSPAPPPPPEHYHESMWPQMRAYAVSDDEYRANNPIPYAICPVCQDTEIDIFGIPPHNTADNGLEEGHVLMCGHMVCVYCWYGIQEHSPEDEGDPPLAIVKCPVCRVLLYDPEDAEAPLFARQLPSTAGTSQLFPGSQDRRTAFWRIPLTAAGFRPEIRASPDPPAPTPWQPQITIRPEIVEIARAADNLLSQRGAPGQSDQVVTARQPGAVEPSVETSGRILQGAVFNRRDVVNHNNNVNTADADGEHDDDENRPHHHSQPTLNLRSRAVTRAQPTQASRARHRTTQRSTVIHQQTPPDEDEEPEHASAPVTHDNASNHADSDGDVSEEATSSDPGQEDGQEASFVRPSRAADNNRPPGRNARASQSSRRPQQYRTGGREEPPNDGHGGYGNTGGAPSHNGQGGDGDDDTGSESENGGEGDLFEHSSNEESDQESEEDAKTTNTEDGPRRSGDSQRPTTRSQTPNAASGGRPWAQHPQHVTRGDFAELHRGLAGLRRDLALAGVTGLTDNSTTNSRESTATSGGGNPSALATRADVAELRLDIAVLRRDIARGNENASRVGRSIQTDDDDPNDVQPSNPRNRAATNSASATPAASSSEPQQQRRRPASEAFAPPSLPRPTGRRIRATGTPYRGQNRLQSRYLPAAAAMRARMQGTGGTNVNTTSNNTASEDEEGNGDGDGGGENGDDDDDDIASSSEDDRQGRRAKRRQTGRARR